LHPLISDASREIEALSDTSILPPKLEWIAKAGWAGRAIGVRETTEEKGAQEPH
jgi:hypothetical protein